MNQGNSRPGDERYGAFGGDRDDQREGRDSRRTEQQSDQSWQRQQQADSGGWLGHRQQGGGSDWQGQGNMQQGGSGADWRGARQQGGSASQSSSSVSDNGGGYGGYEGRARRYDEGYGEGRYGEYGEGRGGSRGDAGSQRRSDRERWGAWHQENGGRGSEWTSQQGSQRDEWAQGRPSWDSPANRPGGSMQGRRGGWERGSQQHNPWAEGSQSSSQGAPDMRTHYRSGYGVSDYEQPGGESYRSQRSAAGDWLDERERRDLWGGGRQGMDERAYDQFTGANERSSLNRGYGGAGGSAAARRARAVGPKGYQRSDERIREDLCERLALSSRLDVRDVEVNVSGGVVTLSGTVRDRQQKYRIEDMADEVFGVKDVHNQIRVARDDSDSAGRQRYGSQEFGGQSGASGGAAASGTSRGSTSGSSAGSTSGSTLGSTSGSASSAAGSSGSAGGGLGSAGFGKSDQ